MAGALYFLVIVAIGAIVALSFGTVFLLFPFVVIALALLALPPILAAVRKSGVGAPDPPPPGTATTDEASYDPVNRPEDRIREG